MSQVELSRPIPTSTGPTDVSLAAIAAAIALRLKRGVYRRELAALTDRQLRDAGIDLSMAGRGRTVAADARMWRRIQGLS